MESDLGEVVIMEESGKRTYLDIGTEQTSELIGKKRNIDEVFIPVKKHMLPVFFELLKISIINDVFDDTEEFLDVKMWMFFGRHVVLQNLNY